MSRCSPWAGLLSLVVLLALAGPGCADGSNPMPRRDASAPEGGIMDGGVRPDAPPSDAFVPPPEDAGRGDAGTCEACAEDSDCMEGYCAELASGGMACLPACEIDIPDCPERFDCVANFTSSIPEPVCAPVGERCCVDPDGDLHGSGVGCLEIDCDETDPEVNASGNETCDGVDEDCDGDVDEGDPSVLCPQGTHVAATACDTGACVIAACEPGFDDCNGEASDGCEVDIDTVSDCGSCGARCELPNVLTHLCDGGGCRIAECVPGFGDCNGLATDGCEQPLTTNTHCGACGTTCGLANATATCATGTCEIDTCNRNWGDCDGQDASGCETPLVTNTDCGTCGTVCAPSGGAGDCSTGMCRVSTCAEGVADCNMDTADGCETSTRTLENCGVCGLTCSFPNATASCASGACSLLDCVAGFGNCDGITSNGCETALATTTHCGACGRACAPANAVGECSSGSCGIAMCNPGWADCDGSVANGCETSLRTLTDCGGCGMTCTRPGALADCSTGTCRTASCLSAFGDCDGSDANGCETSTRTLTDCGTCGTLCDRANASETCTSGTCSIASCETGFANCDGIDSNGCETSLRTLVSCGTCGAPCTRPNATAECSTGACRIEFCNPGFANCDGIDSNGCETSLTTVSNCGGCGVACSLANAGESCASGTCEITTCAAGYADCDVSDANGCETSLRTLTDCGACGVACSRANGTGSCVSGTCSIASCDPGYGNCDGSDSNGCEAQLTSLTHCGSCGSACDLANAGESCSSGTCTLGTCTAGFGNCDGSTTNGCETALSTLTNCGGCGTVCNLDNATESCATGACEISACAANYDDCDGVESNGCEQSLRALSDCGGCDVACTRANATATCGTGACGIASCNAGYGNCDSVDANGCETPLSTLTNCGGCGVTCDLPNASESCGTGTCTLGTCAAGWGDCDGQASNGCETPLNTLSNCGACGTVCDLPGAGESCATGTCQLSGCASLRADCNMMSGDGCETALDTLTNCGGCGVTCSLANASETCATGTCAITTCASGYGDCDMLAANGCETPLSTLANCGGCGTVCNFANASESCGTGTCSFGTCDSGYGNCDGNLSNGCEAPLTTLANCGGCGVACSLANAGESCSTGACEITTCSAGYGNCDGNAANGCEVNTQTSVANCGSCGNACNLPNATAACSAGGCMIASCNAGWADCDGVASNGCEASLTSLAHCGGCGMACNLANAAESCVMGMCTLGTCDSGYGNCDGNAANGCERALDTLTSCGGCGVACNLANASESCASGSCTLGSCDAGYGNCDGVSSNGCEASLSTLSNCGMCGSTCSRPNASATCSSGSCAVQSCNPGWGNCDGNGANGCETNTDTSVTACGGCSTNCQTAPHPNATGEACSAGVCSVSSCQSGYYDINDVFSDGCECQADGWGNTCDVAAVIPNVTLGSTPVTRTGNLVGGADGTADEDWFRVTFPAAASCSYRPRITVTTTPSSLPVAFRVFTSCSTGVGGGGLSCNGTGESGNSASQLLTSWDYNNSTTCGNNAAIDATPATGAFITAPTTVWIQVVRTGSSPTCLPYTLTLSN